MQLHFFGKRHPAFTALVSIMIVERGNIFKVIYSKLIIAVLWYFGYRWPPAGALH